MVDGGLPANSLDNHGCSRLSMVNDGETTSRLIRMNDGVEIGLSIVADDGSC